MQNTSQGGGSTITQQLAKNLFPRDINENRGKIARTTKLVVSKLKEWITALKLEYNYTKEEIAKMDKEERKKVVLFGGGANLGAYAGFAYALSNNAPSNTSARVGSRLCFKSSALAKYAGEQFAEIYFAFVGK